MSKRTKRRLTIRGVLSALIILVLVRSIIMRSYENAFVCILSLVLFCLFIVSLLTKRVNSPDELVMLTCLLFLSLTQDYARNFCFLLCLYLLIHYEKSNSAPSLMAKSRRSQHERKKKAK